MSKAENTSAKTSLMSRMGAAVRGSAGGVAHSLLMMMCGETGESLGFWVAWVGRDKPSWKW